MIQRWHLNKHVFKASFQLHHSDYYHLVYYHDYASQPMTSFH